MVPFRKRTVAIILFTILIIFLVNLAWWMFYKNTAQSFEFQLSHRLAALATLGATGLSLETTTALHDGYLSAYDITLEWLEKVRRADSLSEVFIIDSDYHYLATTLPESDSIYYLSALNGRQIDSIFLIGWSGNEETSDRQVIVSDGYYVGDIILKSAFAPLYDSLGIVIAVLGVEADVDYSEALFGLRRNLYFSTIISICGGLIFGFFFFMIQRRINSAERSLFLSQAQANLGRMVAVVSHEIKNPLMIIRASAERLQKKGDREAGFIVEETDRLNNIVTGYLDFAGGKRKMNLQKVNAEKIIRSVVDQFSPQLARDKIILKFDSEINSPDIKADEVALRQVLINLILNGAEAVRAVDNGTIDIGCNNESGQLVIQITDNGDGIDKKKKKMIFEPFFTTRTTGSGLGLFHSRRLVREMGGDIDVISKTGGPTIFSVRLPLADKGK